MKGIIINRDVTNEQHPPISSIQHAFIYMKGQYGQNILIALCYYCYIICMTPVSTHMGQALRD